MSSTLAKKSQFKNIFPEKYLKRLLFYSILFFFVAPPKCEEEIEITTHLLTEMTDRDVDITGPIDILFISRKTLSSI